jgi:quercetin dioxygenase-like cupin family protein
MKVESYTKDLVFTGDKVQTKVILESSFTKEIRILLKHGQTMKEHKAPFPIVVHVLDGEIAFGVQGEVHSLQKGAIISLESNVPHDLTAQKDSVVRLTLSKPDTAARVEKVVEST